MAGRRFIAAGVLVLAGCGGGDSRPVVLVSAAASLTDVFAAIESAYEAAHPDVDVVLNLAGSAALREQILGGAPGDVFASASGSIMDEVVEAGETLGPGRVFARNAPAIAVPQGNPAGVVGLADLARPELIVGLCAEHVPCGELAARVLATAGVTADVDSFEPDVRALLTKIEAGEFDVGLVYATDVAVGAVEGIGLPAQITVTADYRIAVLSGASDVDAAEGFVDFVSSPQGRRILDRYGFVSP